MTTPRKLVNIRVPVDAELKKKAKKLAKQRGISLSAFMRSLVQDFVDGKISDAEILQIAKEYGYK